MIPVIATFAFDVTCDSCGNIIKAGKEVLYFQESKKGYQYYCFTDECGGEMFRDFLFDRDLTSFT